MSKIDEAKKKAQRAVLILKISLPFAGILMLIGVFMAFGSGLQMFDFFKIEREYVPDIQSEDVILDMIAQGDKFDSDNYGQFMLTKEDMIDLLTEVKGTKEIRATAYDYQYYWETWCVCSYQDWEEVFVRNPYESGGGHTELQLHTVETPWDSEWSREDLPATATEPIVWGWHCGYRYTDGYTTRNSGRHSGVQHDEYKEEDIVEDNSIEHDSQYSVDWQSIYALAVMSSQEDIVKWEDEYANPDEEYKIHRRLEEGALEAIIDAFRYEFIYGYDGSDGKNIKKHSEWQYLGEEYLDKDGNPTEEAKKIYLIKEVPSYKRKEGQRWKCKRIKYEVQEKQIAWNQLEKLTYVGESHGDWDWHGGGETVYKRSLRKIPATSFLGVSNAYMFVQLTTDINTFDVAHGEVIGADKYKLFKEYVDPENGGPAYTNLDPNCRYQNNKQFVDGMYGCDADLFYKTCCTIVKQFDWDYFIDILETLPESEDAIKKYKAMYEEWKTHQKTYRQLTEEEFKHTQEFSNEDVLKDKKIIFGSGRNDGDGYYMPDLDEYASDIEATRTLLQSDNLTKDQINKIINEFTPFTMSGSLFQDPSVVDWLYKFQEDHPDASLIGLLAIAGCESRYGTSDLCRTFWNFVGWGAFDSNPREGEEAHGNFQRLSKEEGDGSVGYAIYRNFSKIYENYLKKGQDSYHTMRWNNGVHQYCTSLTWEFTNANIRAQIEGFLGITPEGVVDTSAELDMIDVDEDVKEVIATFGLPIAHAYEISSHFGYRNIEDQVPGASKNHKGVDLNGTGGRDADLGKPIYAVADGIVTKNSTTTENGGYRVYINHGNGVETRYMHMRERGCTSLNGMIVTFEEKTHIKKGQLIGYVGSTGVSGGPHLHFEILINGVHVDPEKYMNL